VALIRTNVSEDRIASIFRVHECEQVTEQSCKLLYRHRLVGDLTTSQVFYESLPVQELTTLLSNLLALVHPEDGGDTILRNVGSYKSHTVSSPRR
jgi:hypothetical protein